MFSISNKPLVAVTSLANPLIGYKNANIKPASEDDFPFIVSIGLDASGHKHFCTGTLITRLHVLTAAHCFKLFGRIRNVRVLVGTNNLISTDSKKHRLSIDGWLNYDDWATKTKNTHLSPHSWNDMAIITLMFEVDEGIRLPKFSHLRNDKLYGQTVVTAGWGEMRDGVKPNLLQKTNLRVMNKTECMDNTVDLGYDREDVDDELCTNADPQVVLGCGDSGGPLLINGNEIVGVNEGICPSKTIPIPNNAYNSHMSLTGYYRKFINSVTNRCL